MEHTPPPFFKTGASPLVRLMIFSALSLVLLVADAGYKYLETLRQVAAVIIYPLQRLAAAPASLARGAGDFFTTQSALRAENARLRLDNITVAAKAQKAMALEIGRAHV